MWVALCMAVGVGLGKLLPAAVAALRSLEFGEGSQINIPIAVLIWLMVYPALGHCLLMLVAGTFTGFVEVFVQARGVVNFSAWAKRTSGMIITAVGVWFIWQAF